MMTSDRKAGTFKHREPPTNLPNGRRWGDPTMYAASPAMLSMFLTRKYRESCLGVVTMLPSRVAMISLRGILANYESFRGLIRGALASPAAKAILLVIDSPGGLLVGSSSLASEIRDANQRKPVIAFTQDVCAGAAYSCALHASWLVAAKNAVVGGLGATAAMLESPRIGAEMRVLHPHGFEPESPFGEQVLAEWANLTKQASHLVLDLAVSARGFNREAAESLAGGKIHLAQHAAPLGLVDEVGDYQRAVQVAAEAAMGQLPTRRQ